MIKPTADLERIIGYTFKQSAYLKEALTHRSFSAKHNERLEYLGDAVLNLVIAKALFEKFPNVSEGQLTRLRARLVNEEGCAQVAQTLRLDQYCQMGLGEKKSGGAARQAIQADLLEAVLGAIFLDSDYDTAAACVRRWYDELLTDIQPVDAKKDAKTRLQEWCQSQKMALPEYVTLSETGPAHDQVFEVACYLKSRQWATKAKANSKRKAAQQAAEDMLKQVGQS